jgi:hypothetical protein
MNGDEFVGGIDVGLGLEWYCCSGVDDAIGLLGEAADCGNVFDGEGER